MLKRFRSAAIAVAALCLTSTIMYAAGLWSTLPIIEGSSYCASTVTGTGSLGGITGQGQGTLGSICAQTVPAGPAAVTGNEVVPVDLYNPSSVTSSQGGAPQTTALITMANLNALPMLVTSVVSQTTTTVPVTNQTGGVILVSTGTMTKVTVNTPSAPIDGQQFAVSANQTVTTFSVSAANGQTLSNGPTTLTSSTVAPMGYRWMWNAAAATWYRLQ